VVLVESFARAQGIPTYLPANTTDFNSLRSPPGNSGAIDGFANEIADVPSPCVRAGKFEQDQQS